ncbi:MAG: hypothetical protein WC861_06265 [Candidatus Micrarchaeia archaeon]
MDMNKAAMALLALLLVSAFAAVYLLNANSALEQKVASLSASVADASQQIAGLQAKHSLLAQKYEKAQVELADTKSLLSMTNASLALAQSQLIQSERALNESRQSLAGQQQKADAIGAELLQLETTINSSIAWFRDNAYMPANYTWTADIFMSRVMSDCVDKGSLNLACVSYLMENTAFAIHYRSDIVSGSDDHLQSVKETIGLGWGDCEDYSLIFKAILNSARKENTSLSIVAWQPAESGEFRIYPKESSDSNEPYWVYKNAKGASMGAPSHAYVICYSVDAQSGHCTVALSDADVQSSSQVPLLQGAYAFEPQSGRYLGKLGETLSICESAGCKQMGGKVWLVIADSDLYVYGERGWQGYADYLSRVTETRSSILN